MKPSVVLTFFLISIMSISCGSQKTNTFWVNSYKSDCQSGEAKTTCIQINNNDDLANPSWEYFHGNIEGYTFKPGVFQKIKVTETQLDLKDVPADASSIKFTLVKILEEKRDDRYILNDIWVAKKIFGKDFISNMKQPNLEINVSQMKIHGSDGCNSFNGSITTLTSNDIAFGPLMSTRKLCRPGNISKDFNEALHASNTYKREGLFLVFYDNEANEMIRFIKVD